jgi:hypothetical protein
MNLAAESMSRLAGGHLQGAGLVECPLPDGGPLGQVQAGVGGEGQSSEGGHDEGKRSRMCDLTGAKSSIDRNSPGFRVVLPVLVSSPEERMAHHSWT